MNRNKAKLQLKRVKITMKIIIKKQIKKHEEKKTKKLNP